jgi:hypothetical protein
MTTCCGCRDDEAYKYGECFCLCHTRSHQNATAPLPVHCVRDSGLSTVRASNRAGTVPARSKATGEQSLYNHLTARRDGNDF